MGRAHVVVTVHQQFLKMVLGSLGDGMVHRCEDLANEHGVVIRTIYRAIAELRKLGNNIQGSTGHMGGVRLKPINKERAA